MLTTILKLVPQLAVIVLGAWLLVTDPPRVLRAHAAQPASWHEVSSVSTLALFAMLGIECAMVPGRPACAIRSATSRARRWSGTLSDRR